MKLLVWIVLACACVGLEVRHADACATAPPQGKEAQVAEEEAVILWDPKTRTEQFIRRAKFSSTARSFGFLVPTPTAPTLGEVDDVVFWRLGEAIRPAIVHEKHGIDVRGWSLLWEACAGGMMKAGSDGTGAAAPSVRVISTAHVAGLDATTVEADDAKALAAWLAEHGFATTPALTAWLERYVQDKWKITAFVVASDQQDGTSFELATRVVKMTFQTERPFYPYREPTTSSASGARTGALDNRLLRVFFLASERYQATLANTPWQARVLFAGPIPAPDELPDLAGKTPFATVFLDDSAPRRGIDELYFTPSPDQATVHQPDIVIREPRELLIPIELIFVVGLIAFVVLRRRKRR